TSLWRAPDRTRGTRVGSAGPPRPARRIDVDDEVNTQARAIRRAPELSERPRAPPADSVLCRRERLPAASWIARQRAGSRRIAASAERREAPSVPLPR